MSGFRKPAAPATPATALAISNGSEAATPNTINTFVGAVVAMPSPNTAYNLNSVSLGAGTWVVLGMYLSSYGGPPAGLYLNSASAVASNSWTTINQGSGVYTGTPLIVGAVVKLTGTTTIYLNCQSSSSGDRAYGFLVAVQIA
jgi:hypothetical protein